MLRLLTISCLVTVVQLEIFEPDNWNFGLDNALSEVKCSNIEGNLKGCYECYPCDHSKIKEKPNIYNLQLTDKNCKTDRVCCISQKDFNLRDSSSCGKLSTAIGKRSHVRAVVDREYPWRAWVYSKADRSHPLCAATFIDNVASALLAPGKCVQDKKPQSLVVRFLKDNSYEDVNVKRMIVHESLNSSTNQNDIALLSLESFPIIPRWVATACLPDIPLSYGSSCIGVSDDDNFINFMVPEQSSCNERNQQLSECQMCAVTSRRDFEHEYGGGLFCLNNGNGETKQTYTLYGIALYRAGDVLSVYTDVFKFSKWINNGLTILSNNK